MQVAAKTDTDLSAFLMSKPFSQRAFTVEANQPMMNTIPHIPVMDASWMNERKSNWVTPKSRTLWQDYRESSS